MTKKQNQVHTTQHMQLVQFLLVTQKLTKLTLKRRLQVIQQLTVEDYDQTNYSIAFAATDDLSVSYERETSEANKLDDTSVEQESSAVQVSLHNGWNDVSSISRFA